MSKANMRMTLLVSFLAALIVIFTLNSKREYSALDDGKPLSQSASQSTFPGFSRPVPALDREVAELSQCIMKTADFDRNEVCWSDFKHKQMLKVLDQLDSAPREHIEHFASMNSHSAHAAMIPTHQCDMLKIQRFGSTNEIAYANNPSDRHPDGPKWMCPEYLQTSENEQCTIFSIGSNGDFNFEEAMHKFVGNKCKIYTFDCTGNWSNPTTEFHPWCVSDTNDVVDGRQYKTLTTMMKDLDVKKIHLFKVDVEGYEFKMFKSLEKEPLASLPKQILLEVHWGTRWPGQQSFDQDKETWLPYATSFYRGIDKMGYRIALRERNIYNDCCAEYVLVRDI